jgi:hypothetical protein
VPRLWRDRYELASSHWRPSAMHGIELCFRRDASASPPPACQLEGEQRVDQQRALPVADQARVAAPPAPVWLETGVEAVADFLQPDLIRPPHLSDAPSQPLEATASSSARSRIWPSRMLLPEGSRKPESIPYGRSSGGSWNSTPRAFSSS